MRVAVSASEPDLNAEVDPRFGRCTYFVIVESETMDFEAVENPNAMAVGGAGIQSAQLVADKGAGVVLTGHCGPNAFQTLQAAGIGVCVDVTGTVRGAVEQYRTGSLTPTQGPSVAGEFKTGLGAGGPRGPVRPGMGSGMGGGWGGRRGGMGRGHSMGRGMGTGRGCGWGGGMGFNMGVPGPDRLGGELDTLKAQADALKNQLDQITRRIQDLEQDDSK